MCLDKSGEFHFSLLMYSWKCIYLSMDLHSNGTEYWYVKCGMLFALTGQAESLFLDGSVYSCLTSPKLCHEGAFPVGLQIPMSTCAPWCIYMIHEWGYEKKHCTAESRKRWNTGMCSQWFGFGEVLLGNNVMTFAVQLRFYFVLRTIK